MERQPRDLILDVFNIIPNELKTLLTTLKNGDWSKTNIKLWEGFLFVANT